MTTPELPDEIRVPLDEVRADLKYLFGRAAREGHESAMRLAASAGAKLDAVAAALAALTAGGSVAQRLPDAVAAICRSVAELPDRDSPADWPDAMLVTAEELSGILRAHGIGADAAPQGGEHV